MLYAAVAASHPDVAYVRVALPLTILTFGLFSLVLSAGTVLLAFYWIDGKTPPFGSAVAIAFGLALVSTLVAPLLDVDGDARHLRVVRRRVGRSRARNRTQTPGVILFEIDGLGETVMREAIRDGHAPTIARWLSAGTFQVCAAAYSGTASRTAANAVLLMVFSSRVGTGMIRFSAPKGGGPA